MKSTVIITSSLTFTIGLLLGFLTHKPNVAITSLPHFEETSNGKGIFDTTTGKQYFFSPDTNEIMWIDFVNGKTGNIPIISEPGET